MANSIFSSHKPVQRAVRLNALAFIATITVAFSLAPAWAANTLAVSNCSNGTSDAPSCVDLRTARAAERLDELTEYGIAVSAIGTLALIATVFYAAAATRAATFAARVANQGVEDARVNSARALRPYIVPRFQMKTYRDETDESKINGYALDLQFLNAGKTPAIDCTYYANCHYRAAPLEQEYNFPIVGPVFHAATLMQSDHHTVQGPIIPDEILHKVFLGELILIFYGWMEYSELGNTQRHRSEYAAQVKFGADPSLRPAGVFTTVSPMAVFNGMDENCTHKPQPYRPGKLDISPSRSPAENNSVH